jgi:hypothetical protein
MTFKTRVDGQFANAFSENPVDICHNLAALNDNACLAVCFNGAKRKPGVFRPAVSDQSLWFSKGEAGQRTFDAVLPRGERHLRQGLEVRFANQADRPDRHGEKPQFSTKSPGSIDAIAATACSNAGANVRSIP